MEESKNGWTDGWRHEGKSGGRDEEKLGSIPEMIGEGADK